jgi:hypothetical protein
MRGRVVEARTAHLRRTRSTGELQSGSLSGFESMSGLEWGREAERRLGWAYLWVEAFPSVLR